MKNIALILIIIIIIFGCKNSPQIIKESWMDKPVSVKRLINKDSNEPIDKYNTLKDRDWIIFELEDKNTQLYPLKIRYTPVKKNEIVYAVGWAKNQEDNNMPGMFKMQCYMNSGNYFYITTSNKFMS
jgi:Sec-independent protein translocase protein TatA